MDCDKVNLLLIDFLDDNLDKAQQEQIAQHLKKCNACAEASIQTGQLFQELDKRPQEMPSMQLSANFYQMLETEKRKAQRSNGVNFQWLKTPAIRFAAQIILFIGIGIVAGIYGPFHRSEQQKIAILQEQLNQMQVATSLANMNQPSASMRLKAINTTLSMGKPDKSIIEALVQTMDYDESVNVRMAAMFALSKFSDLEEVKTAFINSLEKQSDPLLQISLINILADIQDSRAKEPIERILNNSQTMKPVKEKAEESLQVFL